MTCRRHHEFLGDSAAENVFLTKFARLVFESISVVRFFTFHHCGIAQVTLGKRDPLKVPQAAKMSHAVFFFLSAGAEHRTETLHLSARRNIKMRSMLASMARRKDFS